MWPWEHLAFGYFLYSVSVRAATGRPPRDEAVVVLAVATQVPDLVDKTLSWGLSVFEVGYAAGHSILVVGPLLAAAGLLAARRSERALALVSAYAVGHCSHLVGDVIYPVVLGRGLAVERILWPLSSFHPTGTQPGIVDQLAYYVLRYAVQVASLEPDATFLVQIVMVVGVFCLWVVDGLPGLRTIWSSVAG